MKRSIVYPKALTEGDRIAILSPASIVKRHYVNDAIEVLKRCGWEPYLGSCTLSSHGTYSGPQALRIEDFKVAFEDPSTRAIYCSRGGYGCVQLLEALGKVDIQSDPKWLIGFSDVSALHALMQSKGVASIHAPMVKHLSENNGLDVWSQSLFSILRGNNVEYKWPHHEFNRCGETTGRIVGGNLVVLSQLINTPFDMFEEGVILFIEDIAEAIYKIERIMWQLRLSGVLGSLKGLIVGQFVEYNPDKNYATMETMLREMLAPYSFPIAFNAPLGHVNDNMPLVEGAMASLNVEAEFTHLSLRME